MKKNNKDFNEYITLCVEIDNEKGAIYITDKTENSMDGITRRFRNKKDIIRIFKNYLYDKVRIFPSKK